MSFVVVAMGISRSNFWPAHARSGQFSAARPLLLLGADAFANVRPKPDVLRMLIDCRKFIVVNRRRT